MIRESTSEADSSPDSALLKGKNLLSEVHRHSTSKPLPHLPKLSVTPHLCPTSRFKTLSIQSVGDK